MQLTQSRVFEILTAAGVWRAGWFIADAEWHTLDADQVRGELHRAWVRSLPEALTEWRGGFLLPRWMPNVFDCDNHAADFQAYVVRCAALEAAISGQPRGGTLLGNMAYLAAGTTNARRRGWHDINWLIDHTEKFRVFEPADGAFVELEPGELFSVTGGEAR